MDGTIQEYILEMGADTKANVLEVKQCDTNSRKARIKLVAFDKPWIIPFGCQIHINVRKTDGTLANAVCARVDESTVMAPITEQMTTVTGTQLGELYFLGSDGDIKSQTFPIVVRPMIMDQARIESSDDFQSLQGALREVKVSTELADIASQYATDQGNRAGDMAQRAEDAADSLQVAVDAAEAAKVSETNAKASEIAAVKTQQEVTDYVESQKAAFVGYSKRETDSQYANALTATMTGEGGVTVDDAWTAPVLGLDVVGKSEQVMTTGAQFLTVSEVAHRPGVYTADVTLFEGNLSGEYTLSFEEVETVTYTNESAALVKIISDGTIKYLTKAMRKITVNGNVTEIVCFSSDTYTRFTGTLRFMLNAGTTALPWEPYTGGAPSPSPDYPQDIISVGTVSTGKQLFDYKNLTASFLGTWKSEDNGKTITVTGTNAYSGVIYDVPMDLVRGKTITLSGTIDGQNINDAILQCNVVSADGASKYYIAPSKIILKDDDKSLRIQLYANNRSTPSSSQNTVVFSDVTLNAGDTALPWEPYTGGKPSPSAEYPQTLEVGVTGTNLLKYPYSSATMTINGVTFTDNGDGTITANGTATQNAYYYLDNNSGNAHNTLGKNVWLSGCPAGGSLQTYVLQWFNYDGSLSAARDFGKGINFTVSEASADNYNIVIVIMTGVTANNLVFRPMLNAGDTALPWAPYQTKSAAITLTEPLRGIGEYRDRIMCRDGVWGIERWTGEKVLTGNENVYIFTNETLVVDTVSFVVAGAAIGEGKPAKCTHSDFVLLRYRGARGEGLTGFVTITSTILWTKAGITPETFKTFLKEQFEAGTPVTILYLLAAPAWTPLPDATQQALNELTTYAGTTHLTITAGGTPAEVTLEYVQDTQKAIEQHDTANRQYTDNQIAAIVAALPTATQAAIVDNQTSALLAESEV